MAGYGIHLRTPQKGIGAGNQLAFERAIAVHLLEHQRLRQVVVQLRIVGLAAMARLEVRDGFRELQVVEVVVSLLDQALFRRCLPRRGPGQDQNQQPDSHSDLFILSEMHRGA